MGMQVILTEVGEYGIKVVGGTFWSIGIDNIKEILTSESCPAKDVLASLKLPEFDIELTVHGFVDGKRDYDYFCCRKTRGDWESVDNVDFGDKMPYEFETDGQLCDDMRYRLELFLATFIKNAIESCS